MDAKTTTFEPGIRSFIENIERFSQLGRFFQELTGSVKTSLSRLRTNLSPPAGIAFQLQGAGILMVKLSIYLPPLPSLKTFIEKRGSRILLLDIFTDGQRTQESEDDLLREYLAHFPAQENPEIVPLGSGVYGASVLNSRDATHLYPDQNRFPGVTVYKGNGHDERLAWLSTQFPRSASIGYVVMTQTDAEVPEQIMMGHVLVYGVHRLEQTGDRNFLREVPIEPTQLLAARALAERIATEVRHVLWPELGVLLRVIRIHDIITDNWPDDVDRTGPEAGVIPVQRGKGRPRLPTPMPRPEQGLARALIRVAYEKLQRDFRTRATVRDLIEVGEKRRLPGLHPAKLSEILNGRVAPPAEHLPFLAGVLNLDLTDLFTALIVETMRGDVVSILRTFNPVYDPETLNVLG